MPRDGSTKKSNRFSKPVILKTIVFIKFVVSLSIVDDNPSLTIVNEERRREEPACKMTFGKIAYKMKFINVDKLIFINFNFFSFF